VITKESASLVVAFVAVTEAVGAILSTTVTAPDDTNLLPLASSISRACVTEGVASTATAVPSVIVTAELQQQR